MKKLKAGLDKLRTSPRQKTKVAKLLKFGMATLAVLMVVLMVSINALSHSGKYTKDNLKAAAAGLVAGNVKAPKSQVVASTLGFALAFDTEQFDGSAETTDATSTDTNVTGITYTEEELNTSRDYSLIKMTPKNPKKMSEFEIPLHLTVSTNIRKNFLTDRMALPANKGKSALDVYVAKITADEVAGDTKVKVTSSTKVTINNYEYRKVVYTHTDTSFGITTTSDDIFYLTVQNERPYSAAIRSVGDSNRSQLIDFEPVIKTITYTAPDVGKLSLVTRHILEIIVPAADAADSPLSGITSVHDELDPDTVLQVVAKNQPSVVRVMNNTCADVTLRLSSGDTFASYKNVCTAGGGTGSIVSSDGYIVTNGHVVEFDDNEVFLGGLYTLYNPRYYENISALTKFAAMIGLVTDRDASDIFTGYSKGDTVAYAKLSALIKSIPAQNREVSNRKTLFAIQTSNIPIKLKSPISDGFVAGDTILQAKLVDKDFDPEELATGLYVQASSGASDVALLKVQGNFPIISLGETKALKYSDVLTSVGFPWFVDKGLDTSQSRTIPTATQGEIIDIQNESGTSHNIIYTSVPIAPGNSGGPAFDIEGNQIGISTYSALSCPDRNCFGNGRLRDIQDLKDLVSKNHITLNTNDPIGLKWRQGIDDLVEGKRDSALSKFEAVQKAYPANYLAEGFIALAKDPSADLSQYKVIPTKTGVSAAVGKLVTVTNLNYALFAVLILFLIGGVVLVVYLMRGHKVPAPGPQPV